MNNVNTLYHKLAINADMKTDLEADRSNTVYDIIWEKHLIQNVVNECISVITDSSESDKHILIEEIKRKFTL